MKKTISAILLVAGVLGAPLPASVSAEESSGSYVNDNETAGTDDTDEIDEIDAAITARIQERFGEDRTVSAMRLNVTTQEGVVLISGFADSEEEKDRASSLASSVPDVLEVQNDIIVKDATENEQAENRTTEPSKVSVPIDAARSDSSADTFR